MIALAEKLQKGDAIMKSILAASLLSLSIAAPALADDDYRGTLNVPREQWLPVSQVTQKIEAAGFKVHEIEADDGAYEFEATDGAGKRVEGHAHPATGEILGTHPDTD
jgi:hypothetical protein